MLTEIFILNDCKKYYSDLSFVGFYMYTVTDINCGLWLRCSGTVNQGMNLFLGWNKYILGAGWSFINLSTSTFYVTFDRITQHYEEFIIIVYI